MQAFGIVDLIDKLPEIGRCLLERVILFQIHLYWLLRVSVPKQSGQQHSEQQESSLPDISLERIRNVFASSAALYSNGYPM